MCNLTFYLSQKFDLGFYRKRFEFRTQRASDVRLVRVLFGVIGSKSLNDDFPRLTFWKMVRVISADAACGSCSILCSTKTREQPTVYSFPLSRLCHVLLSRRPRTFRLDLS